ncbi:MAG: hypothetical protein QGF59_18195, partial [Pirellulaceae bacterium]|nr:hypothetical protein [Pirellulaceae bacterium]
PKSRHLSRRISAKVQIYEFSFSPNGRRIATASGDGTVKLWDMATRREVLSLGQNEGPLLSVAFSPDGRLLVAATGSHSSRPKRKGQIVIWDAGVEQYGFGDPNIDSSAL